MNRRILYAAVLLCMSLCMCGRATAITAKVAPTTEPAPRPIHYPDYSSPRRAVETFIWAVKSNDSSKISACLYGRTPLEKQAASAFAGMTASMGSMLAEAKKKLGPPPGRKPGESVTAQLDALKASLPSSQVTIKANRATIRFKSTDAHGRERSLQLVRHGADWKLDVRKMLDLKKSGSGGKVIKRRIADELAFTQLIQSVDADVRSGKIKTWRQFTIDFESRMLSAAAKKEAEKQAGQQPAK